MTIRRCTYRSGSAKSDGAQTHLDHVARDRNRAPTYVVGASAAGFIESWHSAAVTSLGLFWMAFWAFAVGYLVSSMIQVFVTRERMRTTMRDSGPRSVGLGTLFGFISSSCSFAALATARSLSAKGAGLVPSLAFLLASTNLVVELGTVIGMFLGWQLALGEYVGGALLIVLMWLAVRVTYPSQLVEQARERAREQEDTDDEDPPDWKQLITSVEGWRRVAHRYVMQKFCGSKCAKRPHRTRNRRS